MRCAVVLLIVSAGLGACRGNNPDYSIAYSVATGGDPARGRRTIEARNCGRCHVIPGVRTADGQSAPPLLWFSRRTFIAGEVPNTPANLVQWVQRPQSIEPGTAMPDLGLNTHEARDVAAYLYTLR